MFPLPITAWLGIGAGAVILALGIAVKVQTSRLDAAKAETATVTAQFDVFKAQVKALGEEAEKQAKLKNEANKANMEKANAQAIKAIKDLAGVYAAYRGLRDQRSNSGVGSLPPAPTVTSSAARTCFDTAKLTSAMGVLETGVPRITEQGDVARLRLSTAVEWAKSVSVRP